MNEEQPQPQATPNFVDDTKIPIEEKEKVIQHKKKLFTLLVVMATTLVVIPLLGLGGYKIYKTFFKDVDTPLIKQNEQQDSEQISETKPNAVVEKEYSSDNLRAKIKYLSDAKVIDTPEVNGQPRKLLVMYSKDDPNKDNWTEDNITTGYIFKVTTFDTQVRNLDETARVKQEGYKALCPSTSIFGDIERTTINLESARTFNIQNCNGDYSITYTLKFDTNYEITRIYRGDVGYRQLYQSIANDIYNSLTFYPEDTGKVGPTETFKDTTHGFSFDHPHLDATCCHVPVPTLNKPKEIVSLGNKYTFVDNNNFDGIGFFVYNSGMQDTYENYLTKSQKALVDDYVIVKGTPPQTSASKVQVGDKEGILLHGYSWQGNDLVFVNVPKDRNEGYVLIISIKNYSGESFAKTVSDILKSVKFF